MVVSEPRSRSGAGRSVGSGADRRAASHARHGSAGSSGSRRRHADARPRLDRGWTRECSYEGRHARTGAARAAAVASRRHPSVNADAYHHAGFDAGQSAADNGVSDDTVDDDHND